MPGARIAVKGVGPDGTMNLEVPARRWRSARTSPTTSGSTPTLTPGRSFATERG